MVTDTPGSCGGLDDFFSSMKKAGKVQRLMGADEKGSKTVDLPSWFDRRGLRTFFVDSGLGLVKCRVPRLSVKTEGDEIPEAQMIPLILAALVSLPNSWKGEESFELACGIKVVDGEALPTPIEVYQKTTAHAVKNAAEALADQTDYLACLPKSLAGQVYIGLGYMSLAPLPTDPTIST